jgi:hypothetical protein
MVTTQAVIGTALGDPVGILEDMVSIRNGVARGSARFSHCPRPHGWITARRIT